MSASYPILQVLQESRIGDEPMGTKAKFWWKDGDGVRWLFKFARPGTGEHWAEKVAAEVAGLLGVPCPTVELAICAGCPGCAVRTFLPDTSAALVHGNELLQRIDDQYPVQQLRRVSKHTVTAVFEVLDKVAPPASSTDGLETARDWFLGYLLLDAWIGNGDRHHENWGVVYAPEPHLAPSYDHASSLGRELVDDERDRRLHGPDPRHSVEGYLHRARSAFYADEGSTKPMHPVDAFVHARKRRQETGRVWLARLAAVSDDEVKDVLDRVPHSMMTAPSRDFALEVLRANRSRLLAPDSTP